MISISGLGSIRTRLIILLMVAAVPLIGMAGVIAWQNYLAIQNQSLQRTLMILHATESRHHAAIEGTESLLAAIAQIPTLGDQALPWSDATKCDGYLREIFRQQPGRYTNFAIMDANGALLCSVRPLGSVESGALGIEAQRGQMFANRPWFRRVAETRAFTLMPPGYGAFTHVARIVAAEPILAQDGALSGVVYGAIRLDWLLASAEEGPVFGADYHLWLIDDAGNPIEAIQSDRAQPTQSALPKTANLSRFINALAQPRMLTAVDGAEYCYVASRIGAGLRLLVGYNATADLSRARRSLLERVTALAVLLLLGMGAIASGANRAVRVPLTRLTAAVRRWRGGGPFETLGDELPAELRELAAAFSQATASLAANEMQLRGALSHQEILMQEIHHRVKNNMQIVASLLNLQAARIRQPEAKAEFQAARDRVRALATLHRHLYTHGELHTINMRGFLTELCAQLFQAFGETAGQRIQLDIEAPELRISSDQAVPLALIVTEAVSNAIKYAFPAERPGRISVQLTTNGERATLVIADDGVGLTAGDEATSDGMGLQLIRGFARQIGATLTVEVTDGMHYSIDMPLQNTRASPPTFGPEALHPAA
jgi:two-component sensor histidine kinase